MKENISYVELGIAIDCKKLKKIIIDKWQSGDIYKHNYGLGYRAEELHKNILLDIVGEAEDFEHAFKKGILNAMGLSSEEINWYDSYPKSDKRSKAWEVLNFLISLGLKPIEALTTDDIPVILNFLDTPPEKLQEGWDKWEEYWKNLDYPARRNKLLS